MTELSIYQTALGNAIEQATNSQLAVKEYIRRLASMKAEIIYSACIGKEYENEELGTVKVIDVSFWTNERCYDFDYRTKDDPAIQIKMAFAIDVKSIIESKRRKLTEAERNDLKNIQKRREKADFCQKNRWCSKYNDYSDERINDYYRMKDSFYNRKNKLKVIDIAVWSYNLSEILSTFFLKTGLIYENQEMIRSFESIK
jgi:hypothetical protein